MTSNISEWPLNIRGDDRGSLVALEGLRDVPFAIARVYYIFATKAGVARGFHAHKSLQQLLVCVAGSCRLQLESKVGQQHIALNAPDKGVLIQGLVWREMHDFSEDCVLLVLADQPFDDADYLRDYQEFKRQLQGYE